MQGYSKRDKKVYDFSWALRWTLVHRKRRAPMKPVFYMGCSKANTFLILDVSQRMHHILVSIEMYMGERSHLEPESHKPNARMGSEVRKYKMHFLQKANFTGNPLHTCIDCHNLGIVTLPVRRFR